MNLREILDSALNEEESTQSHPTPAIEKTAEAQPIFASAENEEIEKIASTLEALAEEDTLLDDIARLAVIADSFNQGRK